MDNKIETVRIGNRAGVPSVPNVLAKIESYEQLREVTRDLGRHLVLQSAFGDSGKVILGNSITLSPGTVTIDVHKDRLLVHCLTNDSAHSLRSGEVARRVARLGLD